MKRKGHPFFTPPKCNDERKKCFARIKGGKCEVLNSSYEKGKECPFYKTKEEYRKGNK